MLNRPTNLFDESPARSGSDERPWRVDQNPGARVVWLLIIMVLPLFVVAVRLAYLQYCLADEFTQGFEVSSESFEPIPKRDGRILASDGRVLAYDVERFDVLVHYRWLQEPADQDWLRQQALSRLGRTDRRDREQVESETRNVLALRTAMWDRLAQLTESSPQELAEQRARIQARVERIAAYVERRRQQRERESNRLSAEEAMPDDAPWWQALWQMVATTLTTPPKRIRREPLIVQEELDYHRLLEDVTLQAAAEIESHPDLYPGLQVHVSTWRTYPERSLAAHVIGSRIPIGDEELEARKQQFPQGDPLDYQPDDRIGKSGVERTYDRHLRGLRGLRKTIRNRRGEIIETEVVREPRIGRDIVLTLHLPLQERMEALLDNRLAEPEHAGSAGAGSCIVALDVHTGAVLAAVSAPRYDLDLLVHTDSEAWRQAIEDPRRPFFNRPIQMALPPGSVFKTLSAVALLESGQIDPAEKMHCQGYLDRPNRNRCYIYTHFGVGHGDTDLSDALCQSCNVYFFASARTMGPHPIIGWAERFGFGRQTGIDLPGEQAGNLPGPASPSEDREPRGGSRVSHRVAAAESGDMTERRRPPWYPGDTLGLAIGQSRLTVTPMQIARLMAAVANNGELVTPHVVRGSGPALVEQHEGGSLPRPESRRILGLSDGTLGRVRKGLKRVVADRQGTGHKTVHLEEVTIAGKTGTAEVGGKPDHAWFAGYVPADRPRVAFAVVLEHAGSGSRAAGPVARELVQAMLELGIVPPGS